jgi:competence protein ComGC
MIDKKILLSIVIVLLIGVTAASYQITTKTPSAWQSSVSQAQVPAADQGSSSSSSSGLSSSGLVQSGSQGSSSSKQSGSSDDNAQITSSQAKIIAQNYDKQANTVTGTPNLMSLNGTQFYYVPIYDENNVKVGEIYVNAQTGKTSLE